MENFVPGIHHVTAIAGDAQQNVDFYAGVLGLRLVKITVNYDDPGTYHFYYGDGLGRPGTIITFFPWKNAAPGERGTGQVTATAFSVPKGSLPFWRSRFDTLKVKYEASGTRFGDETLAFYDPDGLLLELVANEDAAGQSVWEDSPIPAEEAIRGFHSVTLTEAAYRETAEILTDTLGFRLLAEEGNRSRFAVSEGKATQLVDVVVVPERRGRVARGSVHHIAWRTANDETESAWQQRLTENGYHVSPVMDRQYFRSIYFREPGGVLFEIATDPPGFTADEMPAELGTGLKLPEWLEPQRDQIVRMLPVIKR